MKIRIIYLGIISGNYYIDTVYKYWIELAIIPINMEITMGHDILISLPLLFIVVSMIYNIRIAALITVVHKPSLFPSAD
jgi:hypothetical protein